MDKKECGRLNCAISYPHKHRGERYDRELNWLPKHFIWFSVHITETGNLLINRRGKYWLVEVGVAL